MAESASAPEMLFFDLSLLSSLLVHLLFFALFLIPFAGKVNLQKLADERSFIVLDSIQITDATNLRFKDTNAGKVSKIDEQTKKFATISSHDESKVSDLVVPNSNSQVYKGDQDGPTIQIKRSKSKPSERVKVRKPISSKHLKEDDELAGLLQSLDEKTTAGSIQNSGEKSGVIGKGDVQYDSRKAIGIDVINAIRSRFVNCWRVPVAAMDIEDVVVLINVTLNKQGELISAEIVDDYKYDKSPFARVLADSALRAVHICTPMDNLPESQFEVWQNMQLRFSVADML